MSGAFFRGGSFRGRGGRDVWCSLVSVKDRFVGFYFWTYVGRCWEGIRRCSGLWRDFFGSNTRFCCFGFCFVFGRVCLNFSFLEFLFNSEI